MRYPTEARLEIDVSSTLLPLRKLGSVVWSEMAARAGSEIMSHFSTPECDSFLLSKASLFVFDHRLVMLNNASPSLKDAAMAFLELISPRDIEVLFYQRRSAVTASEPLPEFRAEVVSLWLALNADIDRTLFLDDRHEVCSFLYRGPEAGPRQGYVLQIAMADLAPSVCESFDQGFIDPDSLYDKTDILKLVKGFQTDDRFFERSTYSLNAVARDRYYAIHVCSDPKGSYASLETNNLCETGWSELITSTLELFKPGKFSCFLVEPEAKRSEIEMPYKVEERTSCTILDTHRVKLLAYQRRKPNFL